MIISNSFYVYKNIIFSFNDFVLYVSSFDVFIEEN